MTLERELMLRPEFQNLDRAYGAGKFATYKTAYLYELSLEGADEECGSVDCGSHFALLRAPFEHAHLQDLAGVILETDSDGLVYGHYARTVEGLEDNWAVSQAQAEKAEEI